MRDDEERIPTADVSDDGAESAENPYYAHISARLRHTKYLCVLLTVAAALLFLFAYLSNITYENLRYLLRDVDEAGNAGCAADSFVYTAADTNPATVTPQMIHSVTLIEPPPGLRYAFFCEKMFDIWPDW